MYSTGAALNRCLSDGGEGGDAVLAGASGSEVMTMQSLLLMQISRTGRNFLVRSRFSVVVVVVVGAGGLGLRGRQEGACLGQDTDGIGGRPWRD